MNFGRRLKLYLFGFLMGLFIVYAIFGNRTCTMPNEIKVTELRSQHFRLSEKAKCKLGCLKKSEYLLRLELRHFEVNYGVSDIHKKPFGDYYLEPKAEYINKYNYKLVIRDCDTISEINDINILSAINCTCQ